MHDEEIWQDTWLQNKLGNASQIEHWNYKYTTTLLLLMKDLLNWLSVFLSHHFLVLIQAVTRLWWVPTFFVEWSFCSSSWLLLSIYTSIKGKNLPYMPTVLFWTHRFVFVENLGFPKIMSKVCRLFLRYSVDILHLCVAKKAFLSHSG